LHDLPETREEILTASKALTKDPVLLLGPNATETAFKSEPLADFKIVHIAAHGFVDTQFQNVQAWSWVWTRLRMMTASYRSGKSSGSISMLT